MAESKKWIAAVNAEMKRKGTVGSFTKQAKKAGMSVHDFAMKVKDNPEDYSKRTHERAGLALTFEKMAKDRKYAKGGKVKVYYMDEENKGGLFVSGTQGAPHEVEKGTKFVMLDRDKADDIASEKDEWDSYLIDDKDKYDHKIRFMEKGGKTQGYNDKLDEDLGTRLGRERGYKQSLKDRRDESKAGNKTLGRRAYASVDTMDKGDRMFAKGGKVDSHDIASKFMDYKYDGHDWWDGDSYKDELAEGRYLGAVQLVEFRQGKGDDIELISNLDGLDRDFIDEIMSGERYAKGGKVYSIDIDTQDGNEIRDFQYTHNEFGLHQATEYFNKLKARGIVEYNDKGHLISNIQLLEVDEKGDYKVLDSKFFDEFEQGGKTQGYDDTEDESLGMRTGKESSKKQNYKARRDDSYGKFGKRDEERAAKKRLEELRIELRREMISYGELAELESLKHHIDKDDVELREAAGIPEFKRGGSVKERAAKKRLEELRIELRREMISYGELAELESLKHYIDKDDVELREAAGIPEFKRGGSVKGKIDRDRYVKLRRDKDKEIAKLKKEKGALRKATITKEKCDDKIETRLEGESNAIKLKESSGDNNQTLLIGGIAGILFGAFMIGR